MFTKGDKVVAHSGPARTYFRDAVTLVIRDTAHPDLVVIEGADGLWRHADFVLRREAALFDSPAAPSPLPYKPGDRVTVENGGAYRGLPGTVTACEPYDCPHDSHQFGVWITWDTDGRNTRMPDTCVRLYGAPPAKADQTEHARRKACPLARGLVYYFPDALRSLAACLRMDKGAPSPVQLTSLVADGHREALALLLLTELQTCLSPRPVVLGQDLDLWGTFREALAEVARVSVVGNEQHHPGAPLHWEKDKSRDHADCILRHWADHRAGDRVDTDGLLHLAKAVWRALAWLQAHLERQNPNLARERDALRAACAAGNEL
jgi:hypothetical protein